MKTYERGQQVILRVELFDQDDAPVDEATLTLTVRSPTDHRDEGASFAVGDFDHVATGIYEYPLDLDERGLYVYRWASSGTVTLAEERRIYSESAFAAVP
ncbi:MAG TPA: hypothetical protein VIU37_12670 [Candidatus Limnocylindrales bacterium]